MHVRSLLAAAALAAVYSAIPAKAEDMKSNGMYFKADLGITNVEDISASEGGLNLSVGFDTGFAGAVGIGKRIGGMFRIEGEISRTSADLDEATLSGPGGSASLDVDGEFSALNFMLAGYVDPVDGAFKPYFGGGLGFARWEAEINSIAGISFNVEDSGTDPTAFGEVGLAYQISDNLAVTGSFRYQRWFEDDDTTAQIIKAGVRYGF